MQKHTAQDLENTEKKIKAEYDNMLKFTIDRILEAKDAEIRKLQYQVAKFRKDEDVKSETSEIKRELEFQESAFPQTREQALRAQKRTVEARPDHGGALQCHIGSQGSLLDDDKFTDE